MPSGRATEPGASAAFATELDRMRAILRAMPELVFLKSPDGVYLGVNARYQTYLGRPEAEIVGRRDPDLVPPDVAAMRRAVDLQAMASDGPVTVVDWITWSDGRRVLVETTKTAVRDDAGRVVGLLGVARDVTNRHEAEETLREQEEMFAAIVDQSTDAIVLVTGDTHRFVQANDAACAMLGYTHEEMGRLGVADIEASSLSDSIEARRQQLEQGESIRFTSQLRRRDGTLRDVEIGMRSVPLRGRPYVVAVWHDITEQLRRARALAASEEHLRQAQQIAALGSWTWDAGTGTSWGSPETLRIFGLPEPPANLWAYLEAVSSPEDLAALGEQWTRVTSGLPAERVEHRIRVGGEDRWVQSIARAELDADGRPIRIIGVTQDVTRAKQAADAVLASRAQYRALFDTAAVSITVHDPVTGDAIDANARALASTGALPGEPLTADRLFPLPPPYSVDEALAHIHRAAACGRQRFEWKGRDAAGTEFWEDVILERAEIGGRPVVLSVSIDITDRRQAELELDYHRRHLEDMVGQRTAELATANDRLLRSDLRLRAMFDLSQRAEALDERRLLAEGLEEAVRLTGSRLGYVHLVDGEQVELTAWSQGALAACGVDPTHGPRTATGGWATALRERRTIIHEDPADVVPGEGLPPGHVPIRRHMAVPVLDGGRPRMLIGVANKDAPYDEADADELRLIGTDLYRIAMRRRAELALEEARDAAEAASRAKSTFLANMSHEIRTPLSAIIGLTHLLRTDPVSPRQEDLLAKVGENAEHLLRILNDVLDLSKIEAGKLALEPGDFVLADVIEHLRSIVGEAAGAKGLRLTLEIGPDVPPALHGDGLRLAQVLLNLLGNAVKFTAAGEVGLEVERRPELGADWLRFTVRDSGIGIAPGDVARLFGSFEQADPSTTRRYGGSGLGLAICRSLVELMGGRITVESRVGVGSTFTVDVPLAAADLPPAPGRPRDEPTSAGLVERSAAARRPGARVLLAEDSPVNRQVASELLRLAEVEVDSAPDGRAAVEAAKARRYDLVLMDVQMPGLDGLAATREIRRLPGWSRVPIVAMTANAFDDDRRACLAAGMDDHLAKPVDPDRLYATLERWIPEAGPRAADDEPRTGGPGAGEGPATGRVPVAAGTQGAQAPVGVHAIAGLPGVAAGPWLAGGPTAWGGYLRLLEDCCARHADDATAIRRHLADGQPARAGRVARTLRRVAAGLGLEALDRAAGEVEASLDAGDDDARESALEALSNTLRDLVGALAAAGAGLGAAPGPDAEEQGAA